MLSPQRRAQMDAVLSQSATRPKTALTPQRRAQMDAVLGNNQKSIGGFAKNVVTSGARLLGDTASAALNVFNPNMEKNTVANMARLTTGVAQLADPTRGNQIVSAIPGLGAVQRGAGNQEAQARAVGQFYKDRYGGIDNITNTIYNDPVGVVADAATVATGVGGALRGGGAIATKMGLAGKSNVLTKAGRTASNIGRTVDPLLATGRGLGKVSQPIFNRASTVTRNLSDILGSKAQKFNKTDIEAIKQATGQDPLTFARSKNLPISATRKSVGKVQDATQIIQDQYDALVRTGQKVNRADYAKAITAQADSLLANADTPQTRALAKQLYAEAKYQMQNKNKPMTDSFLTDTKSAALKHATKNQINDPLISGTEEQLGRAGIEALEQYSPGSKQLGKTLRGYRTYLEKLDNQANTGKGTQPFNILKPAGAGLIAGAGAGSFIPGFGNVAGAITGAALVTLINSPQFLAKASNLLYKASQAGVTMPPMQRSVLMKMYDAGRAGRMFTPTSQEQPTVEKILSMPEFQEEIPYQNYTPQSDLLDNIARVQGLDVEEMRRKRKAGLFSR